MLKNWGALFPKQLRNTLKKRESINKPHLKHQQVSGLLQWCRYRELWAKSAQAPCPAAVGCKEPACRRGQWVLVVLGKHVLTSIGSVSSFLCCLWILQLADCTRTARIKIRVHFLGLPCRVGALVWSAFFMCSREQRPLAKGLSLVGMSALAPFVFTLHQQPRALRTHSTLRAVSVSSISVAILHQFHDLFLLSTVCAQLHSDPCLQSFSSHTSATAGTIVTGLCWLQISVSLAVGMKCKLMSWVEKRSLCYNILGVSDGLFCAIIVWNVVFYCCHLTLWIFRSQVLMLQPSLFPPNSPWVCSILLSVLFLRAVKGKISCLEESRAPKSFHLCNVLAREEQVMCTSDPAGAFLDCLSYEVTTNNYVKGLQAACALLPLHNSQCIH